MKQWFWKVGSFQKFEMSNIFPGQVSKILQDFMQKHAFSSKIS